MLEREVWNRPSAQAIIFFLLFPLSFYGLSQVQIMCGGFSFAVYSVTVWIPAFCSFRDLGLCGAPICLCVCVGNPQTPEWDLRCRDSLHNPSHLESWHRRANFVWTNDSVLRRPVHRSLSTSSWRDVDYAVLCLRPPLPAVGVPEALPPPPPPLPLPPPLICANVLYWEELTKRGYESRCINV